MSQKDSRLRSGMEGIGHGLVGPYLVVCRTNVQILVPRVGRLLFLHPVVKKGTNRGNYSHLVAGTHPRKKNHEAVASQQLAPAHMTAPDYDLFTRRENQQKQTGSAAGITRVGISSQGLRPLESHAGISTRGSVTSYLLDWHQNSNWCCQKNCRSSSLWKQPPGGAGGENECYDVI